VREEKTKNEELLTIYGDPSRTSMNDKDNEGNVPITLRNACFVPVLTVS
jgi:hypothetical protein